MLEAILVLVLVLWVAERAYQQHQWARERRQLLNAALARTTSEQIALNYADRPVQTSDPDEWVPEGFENQAGL